MRALKYIVPMVLVVAIVAAGGIVYANQRATDARTKAEHIATIHLIAVKQSDTARQNRAVKTAYNKGYGKGYKKAQADDAEAQAALQSTGYHDAVTLQRSIKSKFNNDARKNGDYYRVDSASCISENSDHTTFVCLLDYSDDTKDTLKVTVNQDGDEWISRGE
jgi:hypothetical protein